MFEYFPNNYVWNMSANLALCMGANIGEIDDACRPLVSAAAAGDDGGTEAFLRSWSAIGDRLERLAQDDVAANRNLSAAAKYGRAWVYYATAERMQSPSLASRAQTYSKALDCFSRSICLGTENCEFVEVPYAGTSLPSLFIRAAGVAGAKTPCMVHVNGLDSTKEMIYRVGMSGALSRRGVSTLIVDQPGTGGALRLRNLVAVPEAEQWAAAAVDYLEARNDVLADRIGIMGWSLGGYYAPRAAAFEKRFKLCVAWGANYDWGEMQRRRLAKQGDRPVPHYWDHVCWVWGKGGLEEFMEFAPNISLAGILHRISVPVLVTHGANDRQIPLEYARKTYDDLINSPGRELKIFTSEEGGDEHCNVDNMTNARDYIADWVAEMLNV